MGLLSTMHLQGRTSSLHIHAPSELEEVINLHLKVSDATLRFEIFFHPLKFVSGHVTYENEHILVSEIKLNHRIPCSGFLFKEKERPRRLIKEKIEEFRIPPRMMNAIKAGEDFVTDGGKVIPNILLTTEARESRSYAYCSDTMFDKEVIKAVKGVDLLYHETTFLHELLERANETFHTTSLQAAEIAMKAGVKQLLIGHFSARYTDTSPLLNEAKQIFSNTLIAEEGKSFVIN
jgi:ribonuclease Z